MPSVLSLVGCTLGALAVAGLVALVVLLLRAGGPAALLEKYIFPDANQINLKGKSNSSGKTPGNVLRVLAFGDSLTEGFTNGGNAFHPYAKRLGDLLYPQLPQGIHLEIEEQGESGERVLFGMKDRLQRTLDEHAAAGRLYDYVLLLAGINDLAGDASQASEVLAGLDVLVQSCLAHGASVLLMTLMEVASPEPAVEAQRTALNKGLWEYVEGRKWDKQGSAAAASSSSTTTTTTAATAAAGGAIGKKDGSKAVGSRLRAGPPRVVLFDLDKALPFEKMDEEMRHDIWDDGVHLTMHGYDHMGLLVLGALLPLVREDLAAAAAAGGGSSSALAGAAAGAATGGEQQTAASNGRHKAE